MDKKAKVIKSKLPTDRKSTYGKVLLIEIEDDIKGVGYIELKSNGKELRFKIVK